MTYYKFVRWEVPAIEEVLTANFPQALIAYDNGDEKPLREFHVVTEEPVYRIRGWAFPFGEYMRRFWVKTKNYGIREVYAMNKTDICRAYKGVLEIIEVG